MLKLSEKPEFGQGPEVIDFWQRLVREDLALGMRWLRSWRGQGRSIA